MLSFFKAVRHSFPQAYARFLEKQAQRTIAKNHPVLWQLLQEYLRKSPSTGCSYSDYLVLYAYIRGRKPKEVLECGTGASTIVIAYALKENEIEFNTRGRVTSMEESKEYLAAAEKLFPEELRKYTEIVFSPVVEDNYQFFRGARYQSVPPKQYDFVFVDGPDYLVDPRGATVLFDFDFIDVVKKTEKPVGALIDTRTTTCFVYSLLFGNKFRYDYVRKIGIVDPITKDDLLPVKKIVASAMAKHAFRRPSLCKFIRGIYS